MFSSLLYYVSRGANISKRIKLFFYFFLPVWGKRDLEPEDRRLPPPPHPRIPTRHICNCVRVSRCPPENGGALHKMAVIASEEPPFNGGFFPPPLIPINAHQITISELDRHHSPPCMCSPCTLRLTDGVNKVLLYRLLPTCLNTLACVRNPGGSRKTAVCSISRAACYALGVGAARKREPLQKLGKEIEN